MRLGYTEHPGMKDVERFMKHYFLIAKDVGDLTAILCAELEDRAGQAVAGAQPHDGEAAPARTPQRCPRREDFIVDNNRLTVADAEVFARDPVNLIRDVPARAEAQSGAPSRRDAARSAARSG